MKTNTAIVICAAIIVCAFILGGAYKYKYKEQNTIVVTGLGEEEFVSDLIVWRGWIVVDNPSITDGYAQLEVNKRKVQDFIMQKGIAPDDIVFMFVDSYKNTEPIYQNGNYVGQRFTGYTLRQQWSRACAGGAFPAWCRPRAPAGPPRRSRAWPDRRTYGPTAG